MAKDRNVRETRPRDEDFEIDSSYSPYETEKKKDYRERPGIVLAILGSGIVLAVLAVLIYSGLKQNQRTVVTTAQTNVTQEEYTDITTSSQQSEETAPGISEKTRDPDKDRPTEKEDPAEDTETPGEKSEDTDPEETEAPSQDTEKAPDEGGETEPIPSDTVPEETQPDIPPQDTDTVPEETPDADTAGEERAYQDIEYEGLVYRVENGIASVAANACNNSRIEVASDVFGYPVVGIDDNAFRGSVNVSLIVIPEGVDWISAGAFCDCPNLVQVVIPDSVSGINDAAFGPNSSVTIEASARSFAHNYALNKGMNWIEKTS